MAALSRVTLACVMAACHATATPPASPKLVADDPFGMANCQRTDPLSPPIVKQTRHEPVEVDSDGSAQPDGWPSLSEEELERLAEQQAREDLNVTRNLAPVIVARCKPATPASPAR